MEQIQWHPAFYAAMRLELRDIPTLEFEEELPLSELPPRVDFLVINKPAGTRLDNGIGEFFGEHNLMEYKSPTDHGYNEMALCQALAYAFYYCYIKETWDVTVSLVVSKEHFNILRWLKRQGIEYIRRHGGIYTIHGISMLKLQVVITEELDGRAFQWLTVLTDRLTENRAKEFVEAAFMLSESDDRLLTDAIVQAISSANEMVFEKMKEDETMESALMRIMKPEVEKYAKEYAKEHVEEYAEEYAKECVKEALTKTARDMLQSGCTDEFVINMTHLAEEEVKELRAGIVGE